MAARVFSAVLVSLVLACCRADLPPCGTTGLQCIDDISSCTGTKCECDSPNVWGNPYFMCYRRSYVAAESRNDPQLTTFSNETREFPFPCRYLMTHVRQELRDRDRNVLGYCEFKIHVFNKRNKGKIFTHGYDLAVQITYTNGTVVERSSRTYAQASFGVNSYTEQPVHTNVPDGPWVPSESSIDYTDSPNEIEVTSYYNSDNNQVVFEFNACGVRTTLVPHEVESGVDQEQISGLSVAVNCANQPKWLSTDTVVGLAPYWQDGHLIADIVLPGLDDSQSLVDRAFRGDAVQNQPDGHPACSAAAGVLDSCTDTTRAAAYDACFWILTEPRFIKCVHGSGLDFVDLFVRCVATWCQGTNCALVMADIGVCSYVDDIPKLDDFVAGALCPP